MDREWISGHDRASGRAQRNDRKRACGPSSSSTHLTSSRTSTIRSVQLIDARAADRFAGRNETVDPVAGHIPGARNRFYKENFADDGRFKPSPDLRAAFEPFGPAESIVHQCGSGISGALNLLAMEIAGLRGARLYAGSWSEWIADPSRPIASE